MVHIMLNGERKTGQNLNSMITIPKCVCEYVNIGKKLGKMYSEVKKGWEQRCSKLWEKKADGTWKGKSRVPVI